MPKTFYSPQQETHKLTFTPLGGDSYRFFNYAILRSSGLNRVLDMMRYDQAFFARKADVELLCEVLEQGGHYHALKPWSLLLGRFDWKGKTKPNWTSQRLMSDQSYEFITDPLALVHLNSDTTEWHIKPPAKFRSEVEFTGTVIEVLWAMHTNRAFPASENDANRIERGFHSLDETITVGLQTYTDGEREWNFNS